MSAEDEDKFDTDHSVRPEESPKGTSRRVNGMGSDGNPSAPFGKLRTSLRDALREAQGSSGRTDGKGSSGLASVIAWSLENRFLVLMLTVFLGLGGVWALRTIPLDAIPDLSDPQVIVQTTWDGTSPQIVEDQVTQPLSRRLVSTPGASAVRGYSFFGQSLGVRDLRGGNRSLLGAFAGPGDARQHGRLASRVASALGWVRTPPVWAGSTNTGWCRIPSTTRPCDKRRIGWSNPRSRPSSGVSEVASVGGQVRQFQVSVDPLRIQGAWGCAWPTSNPLCARQRRCGWRGDRSHRDRVDGPHPGIGPHH
jgi:hypothetical protein